MYERIALALAQTLLFACTYWASCAAIFGWEAWRGVPVAEREWNAYAPAKRRRIVACVLWNQVFANGTWFVAANVLLPHVRARHPFANVVPFWATAIVFPFLVDICFYLLHWLAHRPAVYAAVHKRHHEITVAFAPAAMYCHVLEMWFVNLLSGTLPMVLLGADDVFVTVAIVASTIDTTFAHSRWSSMHFQHHRYPLVTFGSTFGVADRLLASYVADPHRGDAMRRAWTQVAAASSSSTSSSSAATPNSAMSNDGR